MFLILDDWLSLGEEAEIGDITDMLNGGTAPADMAREINIDIKKVSKIVKTLRKLKK